MDKATAKVKLSEHKFNNCKHQYIILSGQKSEGSWHGSQMICQFCLHIEDIQNIQDWRTNYNHLRSIASEPLESQKTDGN